MQEKFKDLSFKDKAGYITAFVLIGSGILIAFLSFFLNAFNIATGVLLYIAQAFLVGGSLLGSSLYFRSKWLELDSRTKNEIHEEITKAFENLSHM